MSNLFINFNANAALASDAVYISDHRGGLFNDHVSGLVEDMIEDRSSSCPIEGALDAVRDVAAWDGSNETSEILEMIAECLNDFNRKEVQ